MADSDSMASSDSLLRGVRAMATPSTARGSPSIFSPAPRPSPLSPLSPPPLGATPPFAVRTDVGSPSPSSLSGSALLSSLRLCRTQAEIDAALRFVAPPLTQTAEVVQFVSGLPGFASCPQYEVHLDYLRFQHPLTGASSKLVTHASVVKSAAGRVERELAEVRKLEQEIADRQRRRALALSRAINLQIERVVYEDYAAARSAEAASNAAIKADLQIERRRLRRQMQKELKKRESLLLQRAGGKRRFVASDDESDSDEQPTEEDKAFVVGNGGDSDGSYHDGSGDEQQEEHEQEEAADGAADGSGDSVPITVIDARGEAMQFYSALHATVASFKTLIADEFDVRPEQVQLCFRGRDMINSQTLHQHQVARTGGRVRLTIQ